MSNLAQTSFSALQDQVDPVFDLIKVDLDMAIASMPQNGNEHDNEELSRFKAGLVAEVMALKRRHEEVLDSIADY